VKLANATKFEIDRISGSSKIETKTVENCNQTENKRTPLVSWLV